MSKQQGSASGVQSTDAFEWEVYHNSETNIFELSKKLPDDLVASLAREVILRVASRAVVAESAVRPVTQEALLAFSTAPNMGIASAHSRASGILGAISATVSPLPTPR